MSNELSWARDGRNWPNRDASCFPEINGLRWHVQIIGSGPAMLLVHGTGASTHSWRRLVPHLASKFTLIIPDLPGHGFTEMPATSGMTLPGMASRLASLIERLGVKPHIAVGHSAGAAILLQASIDGRITPKAILSINGALLPFGSWVGQMFAPIAKIMAAAPFVADVMAWRGANRAAVERVLAGTGSHLSLEDIDLYARLFRAPGHVAGALAMMSNWDLRPFAVRLPRLDAPLWLITGGNDRAIPPSSAIEVAARVPRAKVVNLPHTGHLAHEEAPQAVADIILAAAEEVGPTGPTSETAEILKSRLASER